MASKIYIASKEVYLSSLDTGRQHLYLVYDGDGDPSTTNDQYVIRGGPEYSPDFGEIKVEINVAMASSADDYESGQDYTDRNFTELDLGASSAETIWSLMEAAASSLGSVSGDYATTSIDYHVLGPNSGSVIATVLNQTGYDIADTIPKIGGTGDTIPLSTFTGAHAYLGTNGDDTWDIDLTYPKWVVDQGGDDTYTIDVSTLQAGSGALTIVETGESGSSDTFVLENVDPQDVGVFQTHDGKNLIITAEGKVVGWVPNQYAGSDPLLNHLTIEPTVGSPVNISLDDPSSIPFFSPEAVPDFVADVSDLFGDAATAVSPLVLDLAGTGINLAALGDAGSVYWNFFEGDFANASGWIADGTGLLAIDLNSDGVINDQSELFGTAATDGFSVLSAYDSNSNGVIDSSDAAWSDLIVWTDDNHDGYSQTSELHTLDDLNITQIDLSASSVDYDIAGNHVSLESTFTIDGNTQTIVDTWFAYDTVNTEYVADYDLDVSTVFLPTLRGYGELPDLHIAMSADGTLLGMVQDVATASLSDLMDPTYDYAGKVQDIMFQWAGVQDVDPTSRGPFIDARVMEFLEHFTGQAFEWTYGGPNPGGPYPPVFLMEAWDTALDAFALRLGMQGAASQLFDDAPTYDPVSDSFTGTFTVNVSAIDDLSAAHNYSDAVDNVLFWKNILGFIDETTGLGNLDQTTTDGIDSIMQSDDPNSQLSYDLVADALLDNSNQYIDGDSGANLLLGGGGIDTISGYAGNDILFGDHDVDNLYGGDGNDTYVFVAGDGDQLTDYDIVSENLSEGTDTIRFGPTIDPADVHSWTDYYGSLYLQYTDKDVIQITADTSSSGETLVGQYVEQVVFEDSTTWDLTGGLHLVNDDTTHGLYGSSYGDIIEGGASSDTLYGYGGNDTLIGHGGLDYFYGGDGNDTYEFSTGDVSDQYNAEVIYENTGEGTDTIHFTAGIDPGDVHSWTDGSGNYYLEYGSGDTVEVQASTSSSGETLVGQYVEQVTFADSTTWDLTGGLHLVNDDTSRGLYGSAYGDTIEGGASSDTLYGYGGNDTLNGHGGLDYFYGGDGNDTYEFSTGDVNDPYNTEVIYENTGEGTDTIHFTAGIDPGDVHSWTDYSGNYYLEYGSGDTVEVQASTTTGETLVGQYVEQVTFADSTTWDLTGGLHLVNDDTGRGLYGSSYGDTIEGGSGNDDLSGYGGNDVLKGHDSDDSLYAGDGNDMLYGGNGSDVLYGEAGADTYVFEAASAFNNVDTVEDFSTGDGDKIDIADILDGHYTYGTDAITNFVQITDDGSNSTVAIDQDGTANGTNFVAVATLIGATGLTDEASLESSGVLVTH